MGRKTVFLELAGLALGGVALGAWLGVLTGTPPPAERALPAAQPPLRICVTPAGLCTAGPLPLDAPCGCPDPLRGSVRGRVGSPADALSLIRNRADPDDSE
jgi:hypothetical protein